MKKIYLEVKIVANNEVRNVAFAKGINRAINLGNVEKILAMMKVKGYRKAEMVQVVKAEDVITTGDIRLVDINGQDINPEDAAKYFLVLDGQHRTIAASLYNEWAAENGEEAINVPAIEVELQGNETIAEYINEINITKKEWTTPDYVRGAANINPDNEFLQRYNELIKSEKNPDGYPISTLNLIFCGNNNAISKSDFSLLCSGKDEKGKKVKKPIIPAYNMEIGNKFIQICKDKGFDDKDIAKRYLSNQFNNIKTITGDVKEAVKIFQSITQNDKATMFNTHGNLDENLVMEQFEKIRERYNRPTTVISIKDSKEVTANDDTEDIPYLEAEEV
ncbi:hypothetical protein [Bacteroides caecimuris]|uniref:hypothetical protein n=1 Tax=Bacteroides caecimuris TaxID=1796613 RepID=UPI00242FBDAE|nr:hypothetical protein [Bacteroides caecimuris]